VRFYTTKTQQRHGVPDFAATQQEQCTAASRPPKATAVLSPPVSAYVEATNSFNLGGLLASFADGALVNDQLRDYWGKPAIREWAARDIIGQSLTMDVTNVIEHYGNFIVTANVSGKFDMKGLPDPLVHAFYFTPHGDQIVQLIILRNRYQQYAARVFTYRVK
jgi:hypothetical protein